MPCPYKKNLIQHILSIMKPCTIVVVIAGTNNPSNSAVLAQHFTEGIKTVDGIEVKIVHLNNLHITHFTIERYNPACEADDDFCTIENTLRDAAGIVIASPIWNFSVPSHLKNLIDRMGAFALDQETHSKGQLQSKPFALIYTGGAPMIAWKALMYLTTLHIAESLKYYGGTILYRHFEPKCVQGKGKFGLVVDKRLEILKAMNRAGAAFGNVALQYAQSGTLPFGSRFWHGWFSFLYRVGNRVMYPISTFQ